jgi:hypothetical protein
MNKVRYEKQLNRYEKHERGQWRQCTCKVQNILNLNFKFVLISILKKDINGEVSLYLRWLIAELKKHGFSGSGWDPNSTGSAGGQK